MFCYLWRVCYDDLFLCYYNSKKGVVRYKGVVWWLIEGKMFCYYDKYGMGWLLSKWGGDDIIWCL